MEPAPVRLMIRMVCWLQGAVCGVQAREGSRSGTESQAAPVREAALLSQLLVQMVTEANGLVLADCRMCGSVRVACEEGGTCLSESESSIQ